MNNPFESLEQRLSNIEKMLQDLKSNNEEKNKDQYPSAPINIKKVSQITNLAQQTIYGLVSARKIPYFKQGKKLYFFEDQIIDWIKSGKRKTEDEINNEASKYKKNGGRE